MLSGTRGALLGLAAGAVSLWIWNRPRLQTTARDPRGGIVRRGSGVLLFASRVEASRALAMGARRPARRRQALALARFAAHGEPAPARRFWPRDIRAGIPSLPIRGALARLSGFLPRVAAQHFSRRVGVGGHSRIRDSCWIRDPGVVRRSTRRRTRATGRAVSGISAGCGTNRRSVRVLHATGRSLLLRHRRDADGPRNSAELRAAPTPRISTSVCVFRRLP